MLNALERGRLVLSRLKHQIREFRLKEIISVFSLVIISGLVVFAANNKLNETPFRLGRAAPLDQNEYGINIIGSSVITASKTLSSNPVNNLKDGNASSYWSAGALAPQWIMVDLQSAQTITTLRLYVTQSPSPRNTTHKIFAGSSASSLAEVHTFQGSTTNGQWLTKQFTIPLSNIRYIKVQTTQSPSWVAWGEIEVYKPAPPPTVAPEPTPVGGFGNLVSRTARMTTSATNSNYPASNAVDGRNGTLWNSGASPSQWITLDLGSPKVIKTIRLLVAQTPSGVTRHKIYVGESLASLRLVQEFNKTTSNGNWLTKQFTNPLNNIRYVKVLTSESPSWVAWSEIEVYSPTEIVNTPLRPIGVRTNSSDRGEFYKRGTGEKVYLRGSNYTRLGMTTDPANGNREMYYHITFTPGKHDPQKIDAALSSMASQGYNTVRVLLEQTASGSTSTSGLDPVFVSNFSDLLSKAKARGISVIASGTWPLSPRAGYNVSPGGAFSNPDFTGGNWTYFHPNGVDAMKRFFVDLLTALKQRNSALDALLAVSLDGAEVFFHNDDKGGGIPFVRTSGTVTSANGKTYNMAIPDDKVKLGVEGLTYYANTLVQAIKQVDPNILVTIQITAPVVSDRNPGLLFYPEVVTNLLKPEWEGGSNLDFISYSYYPFHLPSGWKVSDFMNNSNHISSTKPEIFMEANNLKKLKNEATGAFTNYVTDKNVALNDLKSWFSQSCSYNVSGWLVWTWDSIEQTPDTWWTMTEESNFLANGLSPRNFTPCR